MAEVKTTVPFGIVDLGAAQRTAFRRDFAKLNAAVADFKFFFLTEKSTFEVVRQRYSEEIPGVTVVLLPSGEQFVASQQSDLRLRARRPACP